MIIPKIISALSSDKKAPLSSILSCLYKASSCFSFFVIGLSLLGFVTGIPDFLDIAILYTLLNLVGTIAVLKYFHPGES